MNYGPVIDWWIIPHIAGFIVIASSIRALWKLPWWAHLLIWLGVSLGWEIGEHFLQRKFVETWVVIEHPLNAWLVDPVSNLAGYLVGWAVAAWSKNRKQRQGR